MKRQQLIRLRLAKGLTQQQIGVIAGVTPMVITNVENGKIPRAYSIPKLAQAYGLEAPEFVNILFDGKETP